MSSKYFCNRDCEYFPCHEGADTENFNCMFCFCPLFALGDKCGGNFTYNRHGKKDCSRCIVPHRRENYDMIMTRCGDVMRLVEKKVD